MAVITPPSLTPAPTPPPQRNDRTTFSSRVDASVTWLITAVTEFGAVANNVALNATDAATSASTASTQAGNASTSAGQAATYATNANNSAIAAAGSASTAAGFTSTSTTSTLIGTGSKVFTTQASKQYTVGAWVIVSGVTPTNYMFGQVTAYSGTSLTVNVTSTGGSGTFASWNISLSGIKGDTGATGGVSSVNGQTGVVTGLATTGANTYTGSQELPTGASIASAATINLDTATGNRVHVTGNNAITAVTLTHGPRTVIFDGILTLTHHATNNNLPGAVNITTAAGDRAIYESDGTSVYCVSYIKANGAPVIADAPGALVLLATLTPTAAANLDLLNVFSATYDNYLMIGQGVTFGATDGLSLRLAVAGSADTGSNYVNLVGGDSLNSSATATSLTVSSNTTINSGGKGCNFEIEVLNANDTTRFKGLRTKIVWNDSAGTSYIYATKLMAYIAANTVTGVRLFGTGGNSFAATGKIRVYGYTNT